MKLNLSESVRTVPQFYDLDPMNIVWHGNYPRFFELARTAILQRMDYGYEQMRESGYAWPVVDMRVRYYRPIGMAQAIDIDASVTEWENRLKIEYLIRDARDGQKMTKGHSIQVALEIESQKMLWETPAVFRAKLSPFLTNE